MTFQTPLQTPPLIACIHQPYAPRRNCIVLMRRGGTVSAFVNSVQALTYEDRAPLCVARVGIGGYDTHINFSRIEIRELR